jgi:outer membrane receptor protein involved in Fe transport
VSEGAASGLLDYDGTQKGWYAQAVYQFIPHWRLGLRYDWLSAHNDLSVLDLGGFADADDAVAASGLNSDGHDPQRWSGMLDWSPSEFSRLRLQYNRDQSRADDTDHQWTLQYLMSIGSHGAHEF